jgi:hypothetical protein
MIGHVTSAGNDFGTPKLIPGVESPQTERERRKVAQ